ncbi:DUF305 domain-containing protein [Flavobacterium wongokense]|uniref:DUF305 domain-containing protein n=1 Tax=Flavobacterium wongokense TaxID=2910674 RepID=UPI001F26BFBD|nr:DUF305 domain-containing protein [Flavobacterium sp. WG47]MCF6132768.1 DUF305 domain-containing protein [Flavobacterium sp. WG47]
MNHSNGGMHHYGRLLIMIVLSFVAMYILMYSMVDRFENVIPNVNQIYMAGLMTMPMVIIELLVMGAMYKNKKANLGIMAISAVALVAFFFAIRSQVAVGDKQFLKSMIPHHAAAVLMVKEANLSDPEIKELATKIITSQEAEIAQMKAKIEELENAKP